MKYAYLGESEIQVSKICIGFMGFGEVTPGFHVWVIDQPATETVVKRALDLGINFFDTANTYSKGTSEQFLDQSFKNLGIRREDVVIGSKVFFNPGGLSREAINREIDGTLARLGMDYLDLYLIHRFDYDVPMEETMEALNGLIKAGKGDVMEPAVDEQVYYGRTPDTCHAKYTVHGVDYTGAECNIDIENVMPAGKKKNWFTGWIPTVHTDSAALSFINDLHCETYAEMRGKKGPFIHIWG